MCSVPQSWPAGQAVDDVIAPALAHAPARGAVGNRPAQGGKRLFPVPCPACAVLAAPVQAALEAGAGVMRGDHGIYPPFRPFVGASCRSNSASARYIELLPVPISALMITELGTRSWLEL